MKDLAKDISYRVFFLALAAVLIYMLPTLAHLLGEFATAIFVPLLESAVQNMSK